MPDHPNGSSSFRTMAGGALATTAGAVMRRMPWRVRSHVSLGTWGRLFPKDVICPMYHVVSDEDLPHARYYPYKNSRQFEADVAYLGQDRRFVDYEQLAHARRTGQRCRPDAAIFSFDDGFAECYTVIRPILQKYQATGVFFAVTCLIDNQEMFFQSTLSLCVGAVERLSDDEACSVASQLGLAARLSCDDNREEIDRATRLLGRSRIAEPKNTVGRDLIRWLLSLGGHQHDEIQQACIILDVQPAEYLRERRPYLSEQQIRQLDADGFTVGAHSTSHARLQHLAPKEIEQEIVSSCDVIRQITGRARVPFAFPYGGQGIDRSFLSDILARHPFIELLFDTGGFRQDDNFVVHRIAADRPRGCTPEGTNLPEVLRKAWLQPEAWYR